MPRRPWSPVIIALPVLALVQVVVGVIAPPTTSMPPVLALARLVLALACSLTLVLGPGLALRAHLAARGRRFPLALVGLPGPGLLALTGGLAWWAAGLVGARLTVAAVLTPLLIWLLATAVRSHVDPTLDRWARRAVLVAVVVLAVAVARGTWSPGPDGELYGGTVSRTLEVGARSDSRIPFHVVQLVAHGTSPYSARGKSYFAPWSFSHRGPLAGLAASPVVLLAGAEVPVSMPDQPWAPFDREGFAVYRLAMSTMAVTTLLALFALVAHLLGPRAGLQATLLGALTPFVLHETYFTWPKLHAAGLVLVAAYLVLERRPAWSGLAVGGAYLLHPMALFSLPSLGLVWLLVNRRPAEPLPRARVLAGMAWMGAGVAVGLVGWRLVNGGEFGQQGFVEYVLNSDSRRAPGLGPWLSGRVSSVLNTLVPLHLVLQDGDHPAVNSISGPSPGVVRFYLQYWTSVPFGLGIVALPAFVAWLVRAARRWPAAFASAVMLPFVVFAVFWGADRTGLLREGMHVWVLTLVVFVVCARTLHGAPPGTITRFDAACFALRAPEALLMLLLPSVLGGGGIYDRSFLWTDVVALAVMVGGLGWLGRETFTALYGTAADSDGDRSGARVDARTATRLGPSELSS